REEAEEMILAARILLGWIDPDEMLEEVEASADADEAETEEAAEGDVAVEAEQADDAAASVSAN
ncbi:MAG: transcription termination/antitermination protein NusA, partial [Pseudomonadota bacterium]